MMGFWTTLDSQEQDDEVEHVESGQIAFAGKPEQDQDRGVHQDGTQDLLSDRDLDSKH